MTKRAQAYLLCATCLIALTIAGKGRDFRDSVLPPPDLNAFCKSDFAQEWLSTRNFFARKPIYQSQREAIHQQFGEEGDVACRQTLPYNAHPPAAVLFAMPFGVLAPHPAFVAWSIATLGALIVSVLVLSIAIYDRLWWPFVLFALGLTALSHPAQETMAYGNWNGFLLLCLSGAWLADRRGHHAMTGALLAIASCVKVFPGVFFVLLLLKRDVRALIGGIVTGAAVMGVSVLVFGLPDVMDYAVRILPMISRDHMASWNNHSIPGLWAMLFNPGRASFVPLAQSEMLERIAGVVTYLSALGLLVFVLRRSKTDGLPEGLFPLTTVMALLITPVTWNHSFVLLLLPIAWLFHRLSTFGPAYVILCLSTAVVVLPPWTVWRIAMPRAYAAAGVVPVHPLQTLTGLAVQMYAVLAILCLCAAVVARPRQRRNA